MIIDISEILSDRGKTKELNVPIEADSYGNGGTEYKIIRKSPVFMKISNAGSKAMAMEGSIRVTLQIPCNRCLKDVDVDFDIDFERKLDFNKVNDDDFDGANFIDDNGIDIEKLVSGELLIHFPMKTLCRQDCKGLCIKCGCDLNDGECNCNREALDPRMAAIQDVFKQFKEV